MVNSRFVEIWARKEDGSDMLGCINLDKVESIFPCDIENAPGGSRLVLTEGFGDILTIEPYDIVRARVASNQLFAPSLQEIINERARLGLKPPAKEEPTPEPAPEPEGSVESPSTEPPTSGPAPEEKGLSWDDIDPEKAKEIREARGK